MAPSFSDGARRALRRALLRWFDAHQRVLPWRENRDPYRVWISEIMLQQTRVAAVLEHYRRFLERFPDVHALARARQSSVLAAWSGLGYYRRARMMHAAARQIVSELNGRFPADSAGWRELPGIGRYTAAAIASICWNEPCAVVDGNVERVLQRIANIPAKHAWTAAAELLSHRRPGDFNQAMMELGATVCTPKAPQCASCPVTKWCDASFSVDHPPLPARKKRSVNYALMTDGARVLLVQRSKEETVMPGMWELPSEPPPDTTAAERRKTVAFTLRHSIMNTDYVVRVTRRECLYDTQPGLLKRSGACWFQPRVAARLPLTGLAKKILKRAGVIN